MMILFSYLRLNPSPRVPPFPSPECSTPTPHLIGPSRGPPSQNSISPLDTPAFAGPHSETNQAITCQHCWRGALNTWCLLCSPAMTIASATGERLERPERDRQERRRPEIEREREPERRLKKVMDAGDGWHVSAGGGGAQDKTIINRIMLRFRPIAPKPVPGAFSSGENLPQSKNRSLYSPRKRLKRKYIRNQKSYNRSPTGDPQERIVDSTVVTLQLLPVETGCGDLTGARSWLSLAPETPVIRDHMASSWINTRSFNAGWDGMTHAEAGSDRRRAVGAAPVEVVESRVTVESVTGTCMDVRGLGCTDEERVRSLEVDTCPGFISDGFNRVEWVNEAYKKMVQSPEVRVRLMMKAELPGIGHPPFSCRVRLEKEKCSRMVVPCDVWRMEEGGGLAWRLDMKAALSLGL